MRYVWKCSKTDKVVEVDRPVSKRDVPPDEPGEWVRMYTTPPRYKGSKGNWGRV